MREEEKIAAAEAELDRKKAELHRMKVKAEDERRIKAAELEAALYHSLIDTEDDLSSDDGKPVAPQFQTGNKANCVTYSSNDRVRFNDQTFKVCINSDVVTSFAASHTVSASEFGRLKANDRNQGPFVKETSCHKLASYSGPRISEVTHAPTQPIPSQIYERPFQVSRQHPSVHSAYDALRGSTDQLLPTPSIRKFDGDPLDYWAFFNRFRCHVASKKKLSYLLQHCTAEVSQYIQHFADVHESSHHVYDLAWDELRRRYGQSYIIAQACQEKLLSFPKIDRDVAERLNKLNILVKKSCFALGNENVSSSLDSVQFLTALATKLPLDLKRKWVENTVQISERYGRIASFEDFAVFVEEQARVANSVFGLKLFQSSSRNDVSSKPKASAFHTVVNKTRIDVKCQCCSEPHYVYQCRKLRSLSVEERWSIVKKQGLCKLCLHSGHFAARCTLSLRCKKKNCGSTAHNTLLHLVSKGSEAQSSTNQPTTSEESQVKSLATSSRMSNTLQGRGTYLDIVPVKVFTKDETIQTYALLDSGSDRSFCEARLIRELNVRGSPVKMSIQTMSPSNPHVMDCSLVQLQVSSMNDDHCMSLNEVVVVDSILVAPSFVPVEKMMQCPHLCDISLLSIKDATVTLLIGNDCVVAHRCLESRFSPNPESSPDAIRTPFGWTLRGRYFKGMVNDEDSYNFLVRGMKWPSDVQDLEDEILTDEGEIISLSSNADYCDKEGLLTTLQAHQEMLEFGLQYFVEDPVAYDIMQRNLKYKNGRYELPLLWRNDAVLLPNSYAMAIRRIEGFNYAVLKDSVPRAAVSGSLENRSIPWAGDTGSVILCEAKRTKDSKLPQ